MIQTFALKVCPIYSRRRLSQLKPIIDAYNAFNPSDHLTSCSPMLYCTISNITKAVFRQGEKMIGRAGKDAVKKLNQLGKIGQLKSIGCVRVKNVAEYITAGSVHILADIASKAKSRIIMIYNNGIILSGIELGELEKAVDIVTAGLLIPVKIEIGVIK